LPVLFALDKIERCWTGIGTRTDGFFTFFCDDDEDTEDRGDGDGNKGEKEISDEIGIALRGLLILLPLLAFDV
jgi:hypothetical protein